MAAAIQDRLMRQFTGVGESTGSNRSHRRKKIQAKVNSIRTEANVKKEEYVLDRKEIKETLAQRIGLDPRPDNPAKMSEYEWAAAKTRSNLRQDSRAPCVICKQNFGRDPQVLLSCTHVFHRNCLQAFERFTGRECCPLCRREGYETRVIYEARKYYKSDAAIRIQKWWRRYVVLKWYKELRRTVAPTDPDMRRTFYENKLSEITNKMIDTTETNDIDSFLSEIDRNITESREVLAQWQAYDNSKHCNWTEVQVKMIEREIDECPICLSLFDSESDRRPVTLTSCGHLFHADCIATFELYTNNMNMVVTNHCPVCRSEYESKVLQDVNV